MEPMELFGAHTSCKVFHPEPEQEAVKQIYATLNCEAFKGLPIRYMPDLHAGAGAVIGFTCPVGDKVIPNVIGVDIGCGVAAMQMAGLKLETWDDFDTFDQYVWEHIPAGFKNHQRPYKGLRKVFLQHMGHESHWERFVSDVEALAPKVETNKDQVWASCGSLGGGNHFIEVGVDGDEAPWVVVHSGSRNFGLKVAVHHQKKAVANMGKRGGLEWLEGAEAQEYLRDMRVAQQFAQLSRLVMLEILLGAWGSSWDTRGDHPLVTSVHNFIGDDDIVRKGAISAHDGEQVVIPWNMRDGMILGRGKGNPDWNNSAPHGAGRLMGRGEAKRTLDMDEFRATMTKVWSSCIDQSTLDEAPMAYKPFEEIIEYIDPAIEVVAQLRPVYNFKACKSRNPVAPEVWKS